ncbi:hypothetical protein BJ741DRAFT_647378 [Chytriomyces cf. hyalinus JEL632]|nr:hypothetical protein BJ741DRAFT_647378 [Chytriomyces cf. hyalinus JEL632]
MTMPNEQKTIAFFGATGGCTLAALSKSISNGYLCSALARTPQKLLDQLEALNVSPEAIKKNLVIIPGDVRDIASVKAALQPVFATSERGNKSARLVDVVMSGVGSTPKLQANVVEPVTIIDPTICKDAAEMIVRALEEIQRSDIGQFKPPSMIAISTTGIDKNSRDLPLALMPLYHWLLAVPHRDKIDMEKAVVGGVERKVLAAHFTVRASLLTDGKAKGSAAVRAGAVSSCHSTEGDAVDGSPAVGYTISRVDVGNWIFDEIIAGKDVARWENKCISVTY